MNSSKAPYFVGMGVAGIIGFFVGLMVGGSRAEREEREVPASSQRPPRDGEARPRTQPPREDLTKVDDSPDENPIAVDLSAHFNARLDASWHTTGTPNDLSMLPTGLQTVGGTSFDIQGIIQLGARVKKPWGARYPEIVPGIAVNVMCRRLQFLLGTGVTEREGARIGKYVIRYEDEKTVDIPIVYGKHVRDWWFNPKKPTDRGRQPVWIGTNGAAGKAGMSIRLYKVTWRNPRPDVRIASMDFVSSMAGSAPFLIALTADITEE